MGSLTDKLTGILSQLLSRRPSRSSATTTFPLQVFENEVVSSSLGSVAPVLRFANEIEDEHPLVAFLCRLYAFEKAHGLDPNSIGRGVRQFKTSLLLRLERIIAAARYIQEKIAIYAPFDIHVDSAKASTMQLEEVKAAVAALRNTRGLNWPTAFEPQRQNAGDLDILDWLQPCLVSRHVPDLRQLQREKRDNVRNQRENLILRLAINHIRLNPKPAPVIKLDDRAVDAVMDKLFKNYKTWCKFLGRKHCLRLPQIQQEIHQRKILYIGLYLLIWGEAENVRFMPECLRYNFHNMAQELQGLLAGNVSRFTGENDKPSYREAFFRKVITPLYRVIAKEASNSKIGEAVHSEWCNCDDLNEYFWSSDCFSLGWPMCEDGRFFTCTRDEMR